MDPNRNRPSQPGLLRDEARAVDRIAIEELGMNSLVLMENAGLLAALRAQELRLGPGPVAIFCGGGNNGGDGLVVARQLALRGVPVEVLLIRDPELCSDDTRAQLQILGRAGQVVQRGSDGPQLAAFNERCRGASLVVDALLGTGFQGDLRQPLLDVLGSMDRLRTQSGAPLLALDLPSGLDCDSGQGAPGTVAADVTLTFAASKRAFDQPGHEAWAGRVEVLPIGVPAVVLQRARE